MLAQIRSIGAYVPENAVTNDQLAETVDTSDEWIRSHTGIGKRHIATDDQAASDLAVRAVNIAMERAGMSPEELDLIILATASGDYPGFPSTACIVQEAIGAVNAGALDISAGCTGFVYGLEMARGMIVSGCSKNILVAGVEVLTHITNWKDRDTCVLFGDGAGAAVVTSGEDGGSGILDSILRAEGSGAPYLIRKAGGSRQPYTGKDDAYQDLFIQMDGQKVYKFAVRVNTDLVGMFFQRHNLTIDDIAYIVPHQANVRIIQAAAKRLGIPMEKFYLNIEEYANTSAASIPLALNEMSEKGILKRGDLILTLGFGAGLTYGGNLIRW
ncbi:MAG: ketoacyl-ACP synthase III [Spirochaetales bacterium]|nr:ketoacyl-ACP synthase III [Spirochaetales bacterium]